jgi:hypothetical protein
VCTSRVQTPQVKLWYSQIQRVNFRAALIQPQYRRVVSCQSQPQVRWIGQAIQADDAVHSAVLNTDSYDYEAASEVNQVNVLAIMRPIRGSELSRLCDGQLCPCLLPRVMAV